MKLSRIIFYCFIIALFISCEKDKDKAYSEMELQILDLVNDHRISQGLEPLEMNKVIYNEATDHTNDMIRTDKMSHDGFENRADNIISELGPGRVGENVAMGYSTAEKVVNGWLNSAGHRENIEGDYTLIGISAIPNKSGRYFYTQIFWGDY